MSVPTKTCSSASRIWTLHKARSAGPVAAQGMEQSF